MTTSKSVMKQKDRVLTAKIIKGVVGKKLPETFQTNQNDEKLPTKVNNDDLEITKSTSVKRKWFFPALVILSSLFVGGIILDVVLNIIQTRPWLGYPIALVSVGMISLASYRFREFLLSRKRVQKLQQFKSRLMEIQLDHSILKQTEHGEIALPEIQDIFKEFSEHLPLKFSVNYPAFLSSIEPHHELDEVIKLYEIMVLTPVDVAAKQLIIQDATKLSGIVAISTLPLIDTVATFWLTQRLLKKLATLYGYPALSSWYLMKSSFNSALIAGGSEALIQLSTDDLLSGLSEKISTRIAQGAAAGVLSARLGFTAQVFLRHLPFAEKQPSILKQISKELKQQLIS
ncbi:MAG TPA: DUF697 domain-containing protein [Aeromonadales bacterium]|nr:DUF697 domain-containing protein [Aeromonadales bacterium]